MASQSPLDQIELLAGPGVRCAAYAAPVSGGEGTGFGQDELVAPASVMKIQIGLAVESLIAAGAVDGTERRLLDSRGRTPGPVGLSLMRDDVTMSVRDLAVAMMTLSDNVATDELITVAGLAEINGLTRRLGLTRTEIVSDVHDQLDTISRDAGFADFSAMSGHDPEADGPPSDDEIRRAIGASDGLNPACWTRTTAAETVRLLQSIWTDGAAQPEACKAIRAAMSRQLTRQRIATGFDSSVGIAAKSGGLLGIVRNEAGVITFPDGSAYAVAVFTRRSPEIATDPGRIDLAIGAIARSLVDRLTGTAA